MVESSLGSELVSGAVHREAETPLGVGFPDWLARWFEVVPTYETLTAQALAVILVLGSYLAARHVKVVRPRSRGEQPAFRPDAPPSF